MKKTRVRQSVHIYRQPKRRFIKPGVRKLFTNIVKFITRSNHEVKGIVFTYPLKEQELNREIASRLNEIYMEEIDDIRRFVTLSAAMKNEPHK